MSKFLVTTGKVVRANKFSIGDRKDTSVEQTIKNGGATDYLVSKAGGGYVVTEVFGMTEAPVAPAPPKEKKGKT